jgi:hypothetical protein
VAGGARKGSGGGLNHSLVLRKRGRLLLMGNRRQKKLVGRGRGGGPRRTGGDRIGLGGGGEFPRAQPRLQAMNSRLFNASSLGSLPLLTSVRIARNFEARKRGHWLADGRGVN